MICSMEIWLANPSRSSDKNSMLRLSINNKMALTEQAVAIWIELRPTLVIRVPQRAHAAAVPGAKAGMSSNQSQLGQAVRKACECGTRRHSMMTRPFYARHQAMEIVRPQRIVADERGLMSPAFKDGSGETCCYTRSATYFDLNFINRGVTHE